MIYANVKYKMFPSEQPVDAIILESYDDLIAYDEIVRIGSMDKVKSMISKGIPIDRLDHYIDKEHESAAFNASVISCSITGGNPLLLTDHWADKLKHGKGKIIERGDSVIVNKFGGYCAFSDIDHEILQIYGECFSRKRFNVKIIEGSKYINLENDQELEKYTIDKFKNKTFSFITGMCNMSDKDMHDALIEFKDKGGDTVYAYTTGIDYAQVEWYTDIALGLGLNVSIELNIEPSDNLFSVFDKYKDNDCFSWVRL